MKVLKKYSIKMKKITNTYKNKFLSKVILRLDFNRIDLGALEEFYDDELKKTFPNFAEKKDLSIGFSGNFVSDEVSQTREETPAYVFEDSKKTKRFRIGENYVFIEYDKYKNSVELYKDTKKVIERFVSAFDIKTVNRLGLRYINEIKFKEPKPLDWKKYINNNLTCGLTFSKKEKISRSLNQLVFKKEKGDISFTYGIFNKEFPSEINIKEFVLDYDCYSTLPFELSEENILKRVTIYHTYIEDLFESSINQPLRDFLNK